MYKFNLLVVLDIISLKFIYLFLSHFCLYIYMMMLFDIPYMNLYSDICDLGGWDEYSFSLIMLLLWIFFICFLMMGNFSFLNLILLKIMLILLVYSFYVFNLMMFFILFELSMFPILLIIIYWGVSKNRLFSSFYLLFYTMMFSLPFFLLLMMIYKYYFSLSWLMLMFIKISWFSNFMSILMIMIFMVKLPMYLFHLWLLKAHVDAPVYGSMILASILLKLGGYGVIRFMFIISNSLVNLADFLVYLSLFGSLISCLICLRQLDMKILVAYSSVVHMNFMLSGLMTFTLIGLKSCMILMVGHGLCSSAMFYMVNIWYSRSGSRIIILNKGFMLIMPSMILLWFLICSSNMAAPVSLNLVGEIFIISSLISLYLDSMYLIMMISFFSAVYSLYLFVSIQHGELNFNSLKFNSGKMVEYFIILMHWIPLNLMIMNLIMF